MDTKDFIISISYLIASVLFVFGIKMLGKTSTARKGNFYSALAMLIAIGATFYGKNLLSEWEIWVAILIGSGIGAFAAVRVPMTDMPEMVALFNGVGGVASLLVALAEFLNRVGTNQPDNEITATTIALSILIGGVTFSGSLVAYGKLSGKVTGKAVVFAGQHAINLILLLVALGLGIASVVDTNPIYLYALSGLSLLLGVLLVIPIGGADMPVVISLLNSYSGMAGSATGFVLNNYVLVISGALVGSSGIILTNIMCKAMNRSLMSVLLGGFGQTVGGGESSGGGGYGGRKAKEIGLEEAAMMFDNASSVIIVPGYGMAVAQAQHAVRDLMKVLEKKGCQVRFAIHPVAGRMPGHMNVLLAEAEVPYDKMVEMDHINADFPNTDIVLVVGANDIVNPAARNNPKSPIYGMPILNADQAKMVIVSKRSMAAGYAGIENELFVLDNTFMLFGDAKNTISKLVQEIEQL